MNAEVIDPMSATDRSVYADWLEDNGRPDDAAHQREIADAIKGGFGDLPSCLVRVIRKALNYRRREIRVSVNASIMLSDTLASGGTWSNYTLFLIHTSEKNGVLSEAGHGLSHRYPAFGQADTVYDLHENGVVVEHGRLCGKVSTIRVSVHPDCVPLLLGLIDR
jgi:hypothetical protein